MGLITPPRVELVYSIEPDVLKPGIQVQTALAQLIKNEAAQRVSRGESLFFRLNVAGLFEVSVAPHDEHISLPRKGRAAEFLVRRKDTHTGSQALEKQLENVLSETIYPNSESQRRFARLAGLKHEKELALQMLSHFFSPEGAYAWGRKHNCEALVENLLGEPAYPVLILEGPPGVGKTELARTIGDPLARALATPVVSYSVSLTLRGHGLVGELTQNIAKLMAFAKMRHLERGYPCLLLIDEADAILQKRDGRPAAAP
jgi:ATPase family protein associated with various cellular activities (AAA)